MEKRIIDLSHELHTGMPTYTGDQPAPLIATGADPQTDGIVMSSIQLGSHYGTHIDAPRHFFPGGKRLLDFPPECFFGKAICLNKKGRGTAGVNLTDRDIETINRNKPAWVLIYTGFDQNWGEKNYFTAHPFLSRPMIEIFLNAEVFGVGVDFPSIDAADAHRNNYPVHHAWLGAGRVAVENLCCLDNLPTGTPFDFCALPLKMNTEGAPVRALAFL